jgi:hypothetical protein
LEREQKEEVTANPVCATDFGLVPRVATRENPCRPPAIDFVRRGEAHAMTADEMSAGRTRGRVHYWDLDCEPDPDG